MPAEKVLGIAQLESGADFWAALSQKEESQLEQVLRRAGGTIRGMESWSVKKGIKYLG